MAESTVQFFVVKLSNLIFQEASVFGQVEAQIKLLRNELEWMRLFVKDADSKRISDERMKLWVNQIRDATHDAEDVIDKFFLDMDHRQQRLNTLKFLKYLPTCVGFADKLSFIHELDSRVKDINMMIGAVMANRSKYGLETSVSSSSSTSEILVRGGRRPPVVEEGEMVGIKDGDAVVKKMLLEEVMPRMVVAIVGMGGLGKTTLTKKVYNQRDVQQHFDCKAWVCVSQEFKAAEILLDIAYRVMHLSYEEKKEVKKMGERELGEKVCEYLKVKKYLVVMDDVWSCEVWSSLCLYLPEAKDGSKVLITTRNAEVALHATSQAFIYELRSMNNDESWQLFLKKYFQGSSTPPALPKDLEKLGKQIVAKCNGLPLAIVVLGGLLSTKEKSRASWENFLARVEWHLNKGPQSCMRILALSYDDLPYYLKSCFLYFGIFPEDTKIRAGKLIRLWIAEGFIQGRGKGLEDIAEDYIQELIHRSLIQVSKRWPDGSVKYCRMHDLLRDLAILEAKDAKLFEVNESLDFSSTIGIRRLIIHHNLTKNNISPCLRNSQLRSVFLFGGSMGKKFWGSLQENIKLLTVLYIGKVDGTYMMPKEIGQLSHLKFLSIDGTGVVNFPVSIGRLVNLQSLDLEYCDCNIPYSIWKLQQLRCLSCSGGKVSSQSGKSKCMNGYMGVELLTNLQTLSLIGGSWLKGGGLRKLTQLRELSLWGLSSHYLKKGFFESIVDLTALRSLSLETKKVSTKKTVLKNLGLEWLKNGCQENVLLSGHMNFKSHAYLSSVSLVGKLDKLPEKVEFYPPNLRKLTLSRCELEADPNTILEKLPSLKILKFEGKAYVGTRMACSSGGFPQLESLKLFLLTELEEVMMEEGALSSLKTLEICGCYTMKRLPSGLLRLKNLEKLSCGDSCRDSIKEIEEAGGEDWDKLCKLMG